MIHSTLISLQLYRLVMIERCGGGDFLCGGWTLHAPFAIETFHHYQRFKGAMHNPWNQA
jgi:hypothetical protein